MLLEDEQNQKIQRIGHDYDLRLMLLFGSAVTGKTHDGSDLDVAVMFEDFETANLRFFDLFADLQKVFPEQEVDLALINNADPFFLKKILENCQLIFGEPGTLAELRMYSFRRYIDHKRYLKLEDEYLQRLLRRLKRGAA